MTQSKSGSKPKNRKPILKAPIQRRTLDSKAEWKYYIQRWEYVGYRCRYNIFRSPSDMALVMKDAVRLHYMMHDKALGYPIGVHCQRIPPEMQAAIWEDKTHDKDLDYSKEFDEITAIKEATKGNIDDGSFMISFIPGQGG